MQTEDRDTVARPDLSCIQSSDVSDQVRTENGGETCPPGTLNYPGEAHAISMEPSQEAAFSTEQATFEVVDNGEVDKALPHTSVRAETTKGDNGNADKDLELIIEATRRANLVYEVKVSFLLSLNAEGLLRDVVVTGSGSTVSSLTDLPVDDQASSGAGVEDTGRRRNIPEAITDKKEDSQDNDPVKYVTEPKSPDLTTQSDVERIKLQLSCPKLVNSNLTEKTTAFLDLVSGPMKGSENPTAVFLLEDGKIVEKGRGRRRGKEASTEDGFRGHVDENQPKTCVSEREIKPHIEMCLFNGLQDTVSQEKEMVKGDERRKELEILAEKRESVVKEIAKNDEKETCKPSARPLAVEKSDGGEKVLPEGTTSAIGPSTATEDCLVLSKMTELVKTGENENLVDEGVNESEGGTFTEPSLTGDEEKRRGEEKVQMKKDETNRDCVEKEQAEKASGEGEKERLEGQEMMRKEFVFTAIKTDGQVEEEAKPEERKKEAKEKEEWPRGGEAGTIVSNEEDSSKNATVPEKGYSPSVETPSQKKIDAEKEEEERRERQKDYEEEDGNEEDIMRALKLSGRESLGSPKETKKGREHTEERQSGHEEEQKGKSNVSESYMDEDDPISALVEALEALREDEVLGGFDGDEESVKKAGKKGKEESGSKEFSKNTPALDGELVPSEEIPTTEDILSDLLEPKVEIAEIQGCLEKQKGGTKDGEEGEKDKTEEGKRKKKKRGGRRRNDYGEDQEAVNADNDDEDVEGQKPVLENQSSQQTT
ncbi:hypothetical protein SprV_0702292400 [Sparganum proliferum]